MNTGCQAYRLKYLYMMKTLAYNKEIQSEIFTYSEGASPLRDVTQSKEVMELLKEDGNVNLSLLNTAMENAKVIPSFRNYESAVEMIDAAIRDTIDGNSNINMSLIKWQRDINSHLGQ